MASLDQFSPLRNELETEYLNCLLETRSFGEHVMVESSQQPGWGLGDNVKDRFNLQLCRVGSGVVEIGVGGSKIETANVTPGDMFIAPANTQCDYFLDRYSQILFMPFSSSFVQTIGEDLVAGFSGDFSSLHHGLFRVPEISTQMLALWRSAAAEPRGSNLARQSETIRLVETLLTLSTNPRAIKNRKVKMSGHTLRRVIDFISEHLADDLALSDIAKIAHFSDCHFLRAFKVEMGATPHQYVIDQRIQRAKSLLKRTCSDIAQIAHDCGFSSHQHLATTFSNLVGQTPSAFRRSGCHYMQ
jgi:AraC family transcriptional regulator